MAPTELYALNESLARQSLSTRLLPKLYAKAGWRRRHETTAHVLLRDISKILFSDKPVNVPVIK